MDEVMDLGRKAADRLLVAVVLDVLLCTVREGTMIMYVLVATIVGTLVSTASAIYAIHRATHRATQAVDKIMSRR